MGTRCWLRSIWNTNKIDSSNLKTLTMVLLSSSCSGQTSPGEMDAKETGCTYPNGTYPCGTDPSATSASATDADDS